ncbi:unnamed protein product, partial [Brassica oleracea]
ENRTFTFQLKLTEFNITSKHQSFTISRIFEKHQRPPLPSFAEQYSRVSSQVKPVLCFVLDPTY